jgi:NAD-dependent dihydropyrimidine dehydrogenase PreA subunit
MWFPTIFDKCDGCEGTYKCVTYCPNGVLEIKADKAFVVNPLKCIDGCSACATLCPEEVIMFPSKEASSSVTKKKSLLYRVVCGGCGKAFLTDRETEYCFSCEDKVRKQSR